MILVPECEPGPVEPSTSRAHLVRQHARGVFKSFRGPAQALLAALQRLDALFWQRNRFRPRRDSSRIEVNFQASCQCSQVLVRGPQARIAGEQRRCKQSDVGGAAASVTASLGFDQSEYFIGSCDCGLLQFPEFAECPRSWCRRSPAGEFDQDQRMAQNLVPDQQRLQLWV
jgi:hypothetical protein